MPHPFRRNRDVGPAVFSFARKSRNLQVGTWRFRLKLSKVVGVFFGMKDLSLVKKVIMAGQPNPLIFGLVSERGGTLGG